MPVEASSRGENKTRLSPSPALTSWIVSESRRDGKTLAMMIRATCDHSLFRTNGVDQHGNTRFRCKLCGKTWVEVKPVKLLGAMKVPVDDAKLVLNLLTQGMSIRATK